MNSEVTADATQILKDANSYGVAPLSILFSIMIIGIVIFILKYILKDTSEIVRQNGEIITKNTESQIMLKSAIENSNRLNERILSDLNQKVDKSLDLHNETHRNLNDIKNLIEREHSGKVDNG